jgi:hypothetical protein
MCYNYVTNVTLNNNNINNNTNNNIDIGLKRI